MKFLEKINHYVPIFLQAMLNLALIVVGITLVVFLFSEAWLIFNNLFTTHSSSAYYKMTEEILIFFLYFEFIALIIKYFQTGYHFPLRYFIYIGITAIVRLIIVDHSDALATFVLAGAILLLVAALYLANTKLLKRE
ncbi:phosphate-starvation-inducible protein PsiE [Listeria fleischmannii 1991]|uniref:Protein PsiE homolog n=2 Tax=Listeria fleischmannii TaxID=1069827 RepID=A0A2X3HLQ4_9LIST|nr:phosphate-starvation-inducible protein PsiE [Listeria fleischmannii]EMG28212.1 phosphate-starvation-inducible protein PsiE [Listeria fleischmannii subsp. fleischmannii LU2006-1]KMT60393.1 phosphate-starvation-inducible protein PsiE [Listeria fleischmannii 1991]SQC72084.1 phosphate-starvation-inducible protein PsiE [Listeria fleischmannii subsp. fleischmannii]